MGGSWAKRIILFVLTNLAVVLVLGIVLRLLGVERILDEQGVGLDYRALLVYSAVIGFTGALISLAMSKWLALRTTGAQVITRPRNEAEEWLLVTVRRLAGQAGIGMPDVAVYDSPEPNAFATGARRDKALVAVSTGLLRMMDRTEVEAVLAHEVAHVANGDMVTLTLIQGVVNTFVVFLSRVIGYVVDRTVFRTERGHGPGFWITTIVAQILLGILATVIVMWFSRRREFRADAGSAKMNGTEPMIRALTRLGSARGPEVLPDTFRSFGIRGGGGSGIAKFFMSHPPIEDRIAALQGRR
ncbi:MAG: protease HtpX [Myxococcales bacterium]